MICKYYGCSNLSSISSLNTTPPETSRLFDDMFYEKVTLYVPKGCKTIYWSHPGWMRFSNIVELEDTIIPSQKGDANGDGVVDAIDIVDIVNHMMDRPTSTGTFDEKAADANSDGVVNAADVVKVTNIIMGE